MSRTEEFGAESRGQTFHYLPEKLVIVTEKQHPLWDPTAEDPPPDELVINIEDEEAVLIPILVRKNGMKRGKPIIEVIDGRNRVKAAVIVNKRRKAKGLEPLLVPAVYQRIDDNVSMTRMVIANEQRKREDHVTRAQKLDRWLKVNANDEKRARRVFGLKTWQMQTLLQVLEMDPEVQAALKAKSITLAIAKTLSELPRGKQHDALASVLASGNGKGRGKEASAKAKEKTKESSRPKVKTYKRLESALDSASCMPKSDYQAGVLHALEWMMGKREVAWAEQTPKAAAKKGEK